VTAGSRHDATYCLYVSAQPLPAPAALWDALFGNGAEAKQGVKAALDFSRRRDVEYGASLP